jgi:hypothetical protein
MPELAEGARLEIVRAAKKRHRGFESLSLRQVISVDNRALRIGQVMNPARPGREQR